MPVFVAPKRLKSFYELAEHIHLCSSLLPMCLLHLSKGKLLAYELTALTLRQLRTTQVLEDSQFPLERDFTYLVPHGPTAGYEKDCTALVVLDLLQKKTEEAMLQPQRSNLPSLKAQIWQI